ncbi:hypothetical protein HDZ31DRAFT_41632 [Schizophyllum fasciatum]
MNTSVAPSNHHKPHEGALTICLCSRCGYAIENEPAVTLKDLDILRTGALLAPSDAERVSDALQTTEIRFNTMEKEIDVLQGLLRQLREQRRRLSRRLHVQRAYLAPVRRLPEEVLAQIFDLCCLENRGLAHIQGCPQLALGAVCKRWHGESLHPTRKNSLTSFSDVAQNSTQLWLDVSMPQIPQDPDHVHPQIMLKRLNIYLRNSKGLPLRSAVECPHSHLVSLSVTYSSLTWSVLIQHADQWTKLERLGCCEIPEGIAMPQLHTVEANISDLRHSFAVDTVLGDNTPRLRHAILDFAFILYTDVIPSLPWSRLESLRIQCPTYYVSTILPLCTNLSTWDFTPVRPIDIGSFAVPDLPETSPEDGERLATFYSRAKPPLREIELVHPHARVLECVLSFNSVRVLKLQLEWASAIFNDECASRLAAVDNGMPRFLPHLEELKLRGDLRVQGEALLEMVRIRDNIGYGLKVLDLDITGARMNTLGTPEAFALIRQVVPQTRIEGLALLTQHLVRQPVCEGQHG